MQPISEELQYLSDKPAILSNPGSILTQNYYTRSNSQSELSETNYVTGSYRQSLSSKSFGSTSTIQIPNASFLCQTYLYLRLPNLVANQTISKGWGMSIIRSLEFSLGSTQTTSTLIRGESLFHLLQAQSETVEKSLTILNEAGSPQVLPLTPLNPGEDVEQLEATILLPLPFSTYHALTEKIGLDSSLLNSPITITINFDQASRIYGGSGVRPTGFDEATLFMRQGNLTYPSLSLKNKMIMNPDMRYSYPFILGQSFVSSPFGGIRESESLSGCVVQLQSFLNADLLGIIFHVVRTSREYSVGTVPPNSTCYDLIRNVSLDYNGTEVYRCPGTSYLLTNTHSKPGGAQLETDLILESTVGPWSSSPYVSSAVMIDFSRINSSSFPNMFFNTKSVGNQTMTLRFNTSLSSPVEYRLHATYLYNSVGEIKNGVTKLVV